MDSSPSPTFRSSESGPVSGPSSIFKDTMNTFSTEPSSELPQTKDLPNTATPPPTPSFSSSKAPVHSSTNISPDDTPHPSIPITATPEHNPTNNSPHKTLNSGKAFGFLGSLSPKSSRRKLKSTHGHQKHASLPGSPQQLFATTTMPTSSPIDTPTSSTTSGSPGRLFRHCHSSSSSSASSPKKDLDMGESCKTNLRSNFGQRLSIAMGLSSESKLRKQASRKQEMQESVDSFSTTVTVHRQAVSEDSIRPMSPSSPAPSQSHKSSGGGIINHFWTRPRVFSTSESPAGYKSSFLGHRGSKSQSKFGTITSTAVTMGGTSTSATNSNVSAESCASTEQDDDHCHQNHPYSHQNWTDHGARNESSSSSSSNSQKAFQHQQNSSIGRNSGRPFVEQIRRKGVSTQHPEAAPNFADIIETSGEIHPLHTGEDIERLNLYNQLGMQELQYNTLSNSSDSAVEQLHGNENPQHTISTVIPQITNSTFSPSMSSGSSRPAKSSRLGKLGRFKFPSLSMSSIHKSKSSTGTLNHPASSGVSRDSNQMSTASAENSSQPGISSNSPTSLTLEETNGASLTLSHLSQDIGSTGEAESSQLGVLNDTMLISGSASTFSSVGTTSMMTATSGSKSNTSSYNAFEVGFGRKPRQSLAVFLEHQRQLERSEGAEQLSALSVRMKNAAAEDPSKPVSQDSLSMSVSRDKGDGAGKNIFGSDRVTSGNGMSHSGILKRYSRRTVSTSHISPISLFTPVKGPDTPLTTCSSGAYKTGRSDCGQSVKHFCSESDIQAAARLQALVAQNLDEESGKVEGEGRVGRYLFGNELSNMSFGDPKESDQDNQMSMEVLTSTPIDETVILDGSSVTMESVVADVALFGASTLGKQALTPTLSMPVPKEDLGPCMISMDSAPPSSTSSTTTASSGTSASSSKTVTPQSIATSSLAAPKSFMSKGFKVVSGGVPLLPLTTGDHLKDGVKAPQPKTASSFGSTRSKFSFPGSSVSSSASSSSIRPSIFHHQILSGVTPALGSTTTFSTSPSSYTPSHMSSSTPLRPSSPMNEHSSTTTSNNSSVTYSTKQRPQIPHLEPRSAVAEYTSSCSSIMYKKQRSMSLQDADLLTADQFIALMPDETTAKRRFSSEEKPAENGWHTTAKRVTAPDPATILHSLMGTLKVTCEKILDQLATVSAPLSTGSVPSSTSTTTFTTTPPSSNSLSSEVSTTPESNRSDREMTPNSNEEYVQPKILIRVESTDLEDDLQHFEVPSSGEGNIRDSLTYRSQPIAINKPNVAQSVGQERRGSPASPNTFPNFDHQDLTETIWILFDDLEQVVVKMLNIFKKYIATDQFAKLLKESDEMGELSQQIFQAEMDRRERWIEQQMDQEIESKPGPNRRGMEVVDGAKRPGASSGHMGAAISTHPFDCPGKERYSAGTYLAPSSEQASGANQTSNGLKNHPTEQKQSHSPAYSGNATGATAGETNNRIRHRRSRDHIRIEPFSQPQHEKVRDEGPSLEGKRDIVRDYIRTLLEMAEISVSEYMRTYNRLLIVPTAGYRIEGCNDRKKIERAAASLSGHSRGRRSSLFMPSSTTSPPSLLQQSLLTNVVHGSDHEPEEVGGIDSSKTEVSELRVAASSMASQSSSDLVSTQSHFGGGFAMVRVKSLPESKDEWAALQKRKEIGGGTGVGEAIAQGMAPPQPNAVPGTSVVGIGGGAGGIGPIGAAGVGDMGGRILPSDLSMMGDYSKEHMGHEAYYYRNWFLGKEHRTFVGQVEGLGTVIISIIKDMVVPAEARQQIPVFRSNTGPAMTSHSATTVTPGTTPSGPLNIASIGHSRPELVHAAPSFYPGRGGQNFSAGIGIAGRSGGLTATPRTSSEAMRVIVSSSTTGSSASGSTFPAEACASSLSISSTHNSGSTASTLTSPANHPASQGTNSTSPARWQYRCILRQKDVDSLRITLPEPEPSPLNNLTRRTGKPQWKTILQSIHPAITQQVASKLKKVQNNQNFEKELAKFDETMLRFNYKFGVLLVRPGQKCEEDWFGNQTGASARFQEFLESGALGQKVTLKGFDRFSAGLDTRLGETGEYSYFDTWGDGFEIMYHVSTMLPFNTLDPQQIQRKRHIGNDIVCIVFVDGDQPFVPNAIKSQFLHIFAIIHPISLPDGSRGYSVTMACDEQVPEFGPPLPDPPIFRNSTELRAFLLCKMINGENAAYKAPRLIKPHQRARSGLLENLVAMANTLAKDSSKKQKTASQVSTSAVTGTGGHTLIPMISNTSNSSNVTSSPGVASNGVCYCSYTCQHRCQNQCQLHHHPCPSYPRHSQFRDGHLVCCSAISKASVTNAMSEIGSSSAGTTTSTSNSGQTGLQHGILSSRKVSTLTGMKSGARSSLVHLGSETAASLFKTRRRSSNADSSKIDLSFLSGKDKDKEREKDRQGNSVNTENHSKSHAPSLILQQGADSCPAPSQSSLMILPSLGHLPVPDCHHESDCSSNVLSNGANQEHGCCSTSSSYSCTCQTSSSATCYPATCDRGECLIGMFASASQTDCAMSSGSYHHSVGGVGGVGTGGLPLQRHPSTPSSPTESHFAIDRHGSSVHDHMPAVYHEAPDAFSPGITISHNKGRSKSELDLLSPIQECRPSTAAKRASVPLISTFPSMMSIPRELPSVTTVPSLYNIQQPSLHPHCYHNRLHHHHYHHHGHAVVSPGPSGTTAGHSHGQAHHYTTMKDRAQNFLTILVRRRVTSNDHHGLTPPIHPHATGSGKGSVNSSPLVNWSSANSCSMESQHSCHQHHHQHGHGDTSGCHHQRAYNSHSEQPPVETIQQPTYVPSQRNLDHPGSTTPIKFKDGHKGKQPIHINTNKVALPKSTVPLAACTPSSAGFSSLPSATSSSGPSSMRSYSGMSSAGTSMMLATPITIDLPSQSTRMFGSTDISALRAGSPSMEASLGTRRVSLAAREASDKAALEAPVNASLTCPESSCSLATSTSDTVASTMSHSSSISSSVYTPSALDGVVLGASDNNTTAILSGWRLSESPAPCTPASIRAMDSRSSFGSLLTPNSASGGTPSVSNMMGRSDSTKLDYVTFKPAGSSSSSSSSPSSALLQYPYQQRVVESEGASAVGMCDIVNIEVPIAMNPLALRDSQALLAMDHGQSGEVSLSCQGSNNPATQTDISFVKDPVLKQDGALVRMTSLRSKDLGLACSMASIGEPSLASKENQQQCAGLGDQSPDGVQSNMREMPHPRAERVQQSSKSWIVRDLDIKEGAGTV